MKSIGGIAVWPILWLAGAPSAKVPVEIQEWPVPWEDTQPRDPFVDASHRVWFVGETGDYIGSFAPRTGEFSRFELEPGTGPHSLIVDEAGFVWYAGTGKAHIGKLDPRTSEVTVYPTPEQVRDPHVMVLDAGGDIWFTAPACDCAGHFRAATGEFKILPLPTSTRPYGIDVDSKGRAWLSSLSTHRLGMADPATLKVRAFELPRSNARTRRLVVTPDDRVWYLDWAGSQLGVFDPASGRVREWLIPGGESSRPVAMTADDEGRIWFIETGADPSRLVGFDPAAQAFFSTTSIPSGATAVHRMFFHAPTREIWFATDAGTIGRARVP